MAGLAGAPTDGAGKERRKGESLFDMKEADAKRLERAERKRLQAAEDDDREGEDSSMWELKYSFQEPVGVIRITEDWSGEGNGIAGLQWLGGVVLSRYMDSRQVFLEDYFVGRRIIEVGAGCGLTSIYAALRGAHVTITDMDIDKCVENVESNLGPRGLAAKACVRCLEWGSSKDLALCEPPYDVVIAGDCLYEEACIVPLLKTMWELAGPQTEVLLCGVVGHGILDSFLSQVDSYFHRETIDTTTIDTLSRDQAATGSSTVASVKTSAGSAAGDGDVITADDVAVPLVDDVAFGDSTEAGAEGAVRPGQRALLRLRKKKG